MDQVQNEETQVIPETISEEKPEERPERRRRRQSAPKFRFRVPEFLTRIGEDVLWYYDIRLWSPLLVLVLILALVLPANARKKAEATATETEPSVSDVVESVETEPSTEEPVDPEAEALARLADSVGMGRSENVKTIIMWVAINRSEDRANGYGQSLLDEIARPSQWQNYDENIAYTAPTYELAKEVLNTVKTGGLRPLDSDMLWLVLNDDGSVTVRNQFNQKTGQKWREKTIK